MNQNKIITISRQYGSGGRIIGKKLAEALGIPFYDNELITMAAEKTGLSVECFKDAEKTSVGNLFFSLTSLTPSIDSVGLPLNEKIFLVQSQVIKEVAEEGPCVIVGRSANYVLSENPNCINIFLQADLPDRVERAIHTYHHDPQGAESMVIITTTSQAANWERQKIMTLSSTPPEWIWIKSLRSLKPTFLYDKSDKKSTHKRCACFTILNIMI